MTATENQPDDLAATRAAIDTLDADLLRILAARQQLVAQAGRLKVGQGPDAVRALDRVEQVVRERRAAAVEVGADPDVVERIWRAMIAAFTDHEMEVAGHARKPAAPSPASPPSADGLREPAHRVSPRARTMWRVSAAVEGAVSVAVLTGVVVFWDRVPPWTIALLAVVVVAWACVVPHWRYLVHRWETTDTAVYTQTGWWARERRIAPMSRIQTVDYAEGPIARLFGLAKVTVTTASAAGAITIDGLDRDTAHRLVDDLTLKADAVEGDAT